MYKPVKFDSPISEGDRLGNVAIIGKTGTGKSRIARSMIEQDIRSGHNLILTDPKSDREMLERIRQVATSCGRQDDLLLIDVAKPKTSVKISPFAKSYMAAEIASHCVAAIPKVEDSFCASLGRRSITQIVESLRREVGIAGYSVNDIFQRLNVSHIAQMMEGMPPPEAYNADTRKINKSTCPQIVYDLLRDALDLLRKAETCNLFEKVVDEVSLRLDENRPMIVVFHGATCQVQDVGRAVGKVFLSTIETFLGRLYCTRVGRLTTPLCIYMDEAQSVACPGIYKFAKALNVRLTAIFQSEEQLNSCLGKAQAEIILANTKLTVPVQ